MTNKELRIAASVEYTDTMLCPQLPLNWVQVLWTPGHIMSTSGSVSITVT